MFSDSNSAAGLSGVALLSPMGTHCQKDLGYGGPGNLQLSLCGGFLTLPGTRATLALSGATPDDQVFLILGFAANPTPILGGTLVPNPWAAVVGLRTDAQGTVSLPIQGGGNAPGYVYMQAVHAAGAVVQFSNALQVAIGS